MLMLISLVKNRLQYLLGMNINRSTSRSIPALRSSENGPDIRKSISANTSIRTNLMLMSMFVFT